MKEEEWILTALLDCRRVDLAGGRERSLSGEQRKRYDEIRERRRQGEPLQYILASAPFTDFDLFVDERVLIPRPETEMVAQAAKEVLAKRFSFDAPLSICDLGTGSGNLAIYFARHFARARVTAVDICASALCVAGVNVRNNGLEARVDLVCADMEEFFMAAKEKRERFDLIISNPPYIKSADIAALPREVLHEPRLALDGGEDGLAFYRSIFKNGVSLLTAKGFCVCEIGETQSRDVCCLANDFFQTKEIKTGQDLAGRDRFVIAGAKLNLFSS